MKVKSCKIVHGNTFKVELKPGFQHVSKCFNRQMFRRNPLIHHDPPEKLQPCAGHPTIMGHGGTKVQAP
jgi:hypothetical protein